MHYKKTYFLFILLSSYNPNLMGEKNPSSPGNVSSKLNSKEKKLEFVINRQEDLEALEKALQEDVKQHRNKDEEPKQNKYCAKDFSDEEKIILEESFESAPKSLKNIIEKIANNSPGSQEFKNILLTGSAGTGKSLLAEALACRLGRKRITIDAPSLLSHYRDKASENIRDLFQELYAYEENQEEIPVIIINEINVLTDDHTSEHSDTKDTATQLWCKLDEAKNHKNFLLIATTNVTQKMPHQLQSRFRGTTFEIETPNAQSRKKLFTLYVRKLGLTLDNSVTAEYLNSIAEKTATFSYRDIESLLKIAYSILPAGKNALSKNNLEEAFLHYEQQTKNIWDFSEQTTQEEQRHREIMEQNKKHYEENAELQFKLAELNLLFQALLTSQTSERGLSVKITVGQFHKAASIIFPDRERQGKFVYQGWLKDYEVEKDEGN